MDSEAKQPISVALEANRADFHALLDSLSEHDLRRQSLNPGWTNGEILFHMTFAFALFPGLFWIMRFWSRAPARYSKAFAGVLNFSTPAFNAVNAVGPRIGSRVFSRARLERRYDRAHRAMLHRLNRLSDADLQSGMYYPSRWDALFDDYMTIKKLFAYPIAHYRFHAAQIAR